jgi:pimeloyl-ACP methyl ester carboxylesterase
MRRRLAAAALAATLLATLPAGVLTTAGPATAQAPAVAHYEGTLPDGATWIADVPARWNGTLVLFSHGFGALVAIDAPDPEVQRALLDRGYALAGTSYDPHGPTWALESATRDQFAGLAAVERVLSTTRGRPRLTLALGSSMGGLVSGQQAERARGRIDGAVSICGLMAGGIDLGNYQLDGEHALARLLLPGQDVKLVRYASPAEGQAAAARLSAAATAAQATPQGRARVALGTALLNMPTWSPGQERPPGRHDADGLAQAQYDWLLRTLPFVMAGRHSIEQSAGGNASWNAGVDYARLLARSPYRDQVRTLYRRAGLDLRADLADLTRHARVRADRHALADLARSSTLTGRLQVPHLAMHTLYDQLAPMEFEHRYAEQVHAAGRAPLLRQAYVNRRGHCVFATSEIVAALAAVAHRATTGRWDGVATARGLQAAARATGLDDGPAFVDHRPGPLVGHRHRR